MREFEINLEILAGNPKGFKPILNYLKEKPNFVAELTEIFYLKNPHLKQKR